MGNEKGRLLKSSNRHDDPNMYISELWSEEVKITEKDACAFQKYLDKIKYGYQVLSVLFLYLNTCTQKISTPKFQTKFCFKNTYSFLH